MVTRRETCEIKGFWREKRQTVERARTEQWFNMQMTSFIRCAIILIVCYNSSSHKFICYTPIWCNRVCHSFSPAGGHIQVEKTHLDLRGAYSGGSKILMVSVHV